LQDKNVLGSVYTTGGSFLLNVSTDHGFVSISDALKYGVHVTHGQSTGDRSIVMVAPLANLNILLATLVYTPPQDYNGPDSISVYVDDNGFDVDDGRSANETIPIFVRSVADPPIMHVDDMVLHTCLEDGTYPIVGVYISCPDFYDTVDHPARTYSRDMNDNADGIYPWLKEYVEYDNRLFQTQQGGLLRVEIKVDHGAIMLASSTGLDFLTVISVGNETARLSNYPNVLTTLQERNVFNAADGGTTLLELAGIASNGMETAAGDPLQTWWQHVIIEGEF
jgi:hypothetical protein